MRVRAIILLSILLFISGCVSVPEIKDEGIKISQAPTGEFIEINAYDADIYIVDGAGKELRHNKGSLRIKPYDISVSKFKVVIKKEHYETKEFWIKKEINIIDLLLLNINNMYRFAPAGKIEVDLRLTEKGKAFMDEQRRLQLEHERKQEEEQQARIRSFIGDVNVVPIDKGDFMNPHAFEKGTVYFYSGTIYVYQWMNQGFIGGTLQKEALPYYKDYDQIFIRSIVSVEVVRSRVINPYMRYVGTETFTTGLGTIKVVPVFDVLYYWY